MGRHDSEYGSFINVGKKAFADLCKKFPAFKEYDREFRYNSDPDYKVKLPLRRFSLEAMEALFEIYQDHGSLGPDRQNIGLLRAFISVTENPTGAKVTQLKPLEAAAIAWLKDGIMRGWVFKKADDAGNMQAYLVHDIRYHPPVKQKDYYSPPHVTITMRTWGRGDSHNASDTWFADELQGKTVSELMLAKGIMKETKELIATYDKEEAQFLNWRKMLGEQFVGSGTFVARDKESSWKTHDSEMNGTRLIVDDRCDEIENRQTTVVFYSVDDEGDDDATATIANAEKYTQVPLEFGIWCFNLSSYNDGFVNMRNMKPYVYRPELREKLILSESHADLIDALTADMDILMEDIVTGKSGGTAILCQGKAGTGKTLTAEVYSEVIKRPLYRVHSGQLGTSAESVETALKEALNNATRWRAVLLIDEADVFVSQRGTDMKKNAVIGVFLRVLEYYDGLLFLTTNRIDDIDEAILSRCIAQIKFEMPGPKERERLWQTLGDVYGMKIVKDKKMAKELAETFACTGRDIKGLIKLVTKYSRQRKRPITMDDFKRMAAFKGLS